MTTLFMSDLHADSRRPEIGTQFLAFLRNEAIHAEALYVLGDLFEAWIGDDCMDAEASRIVAGLKSVSDAGVPGYFMHGNRDFLIGERFAEQTGFDILEDPTITEIHGQRVLLMHGDTLCTDDVEYQALRSLVRNPDWQRETLARSIEERLTMAKKLRMGSKESTSTKADDIMDVNQDAVIEAMTHAGVSILLHGHTHRPAVHDVDHEGESLTRIVLGDWYSQGSVVRWDDAGFRLETLSR